MERLTASYQLLFAFRGAVPKSTIGALECACFNKAKSDFEAAGRIFSMSDPLFLQHYSCETYKIICNAPSIADLLIQGKITPENVPHAPMSVLNPAPNEAIRAQIENRKRQKLIKKTTKRYRCHNCGHNESTFSESQTRGSDEASTFSHQCVNCGHSWRR